MAAHLGEAYLLAGRLEEASQLARPVLARARDFKQQGPEAYVLRLLGEIAAHRDSPEVEPAEAHYREALALDGKIGRREQALAECSIAIELCKAVDMTFWLPEVETALAQVDAR